MANLPQQPARDTQLGRSNQRCIRLCYRRPIHQHPAARWSGSCGGGMAFVHHTMLTAENLRGLPSKQLHTNVEPHYSPRSRAAPLCGVGGLVGVYSRPVIGGALFCPLSGFRYQGTSVPSQEQLFRRLTLAWDHRYRLSPDLGGCKEHGLSDLLIIFYRLTRRWPRRKESRPYPTLGIFGFRPQNLGGSRDFVLGLLSFYPAFVLRR